MQVEIIVQVNQGVLDTPELFISEESAGKCFEEAATGEGFREKKKDEIWSAYVCAFSDWNHSDDFEIHWYTQINIAE